MLQVLVTDFFGSEAVIVNASTRVEFALVPMTDTLSMEQQQSTEQPAPSNVSIQPKHTMSWWHGDFLMACAVLLICTTAVATVWPAASPLPPPTRNLFNVK